MKKIFDLPSKFQGCLLGLAIGDALGAPVEFMSLDEIKKKYGNTGVTDFKSWSSFNAGCYTDDTQMALATAEGCISADQRWKDRGICNSATVVHRRYLEWLKRQSDPFESRGPGHTCLEALESGEMGTLEEKINDSKGSGGVMRIAPVGLSCSPQNAFEIGAKFAAITHGHPSGYLSAGFLALVISHIARGKSLPSAVSLAVKKLKEHKGNEETLEKVQLAQKLSRSKKPVNESIEMIGQGWVGEEALGISLYCALKFPSDYYKAVLASVNHSGDSDTTGTITGAILGTILGIEGIPGKWVKGVENSDKIKGIADDMFKYIIESHEIHRHSSEYVKYPPY
ncbi:MAG: ADP-ribosylglycohydrolase family protein [Planctomycetota bacterium]